MTSYLSSNIRTLDVFQIDNGKIDKISQNK